MSYKPLVIASLLASSMLIHGCASTGDGVSDAALSGDPAAMERDGAKLNTRGANLVKDGEKLLIRGRKQVRDGEAMVQNGSTLVTNSRSEYNDLASVSGSAANPDTVTQEAKELRAIGKRWNDAIDTIREGNALVKKGNDNINEAQSFIRNGRQMMERGSALVRNSERIRLGTALLPVPDRLPQ